MQHQWVSFDVQQLLNCSIQCDGGHCPLQISKVTPVNSNHCCYYCVLCYIDDVLNNVRCLDAGFCTLVAVIEIHVFKCLHSIAKWFTKALTAKRKPIGWDFSARTATVSCFLESSCSLVWVIARAQRQQSHDEYLSSARVHPPTDFADSCVDRNVLSAFPSEPEWWWAAPSDMS